VRHFSGSATYHNRITVAASNENPLVLDLGSVKEVAVVLVNG
jgi:hypothetical protein